MHIASRIMEIIISSDFIRVTDEYFWTTLFRRETEHRTSYASKSSFGARLSRALVLEPKRGLPNPSSQQRRPDALSGLHALFFRALKEKVGTGGQTNISET